MIYLPFYGSLEISVEDNGSFDMGKWLSKNTGQHTVQDSQVQTRERSDWDWDWEGRTTRIRGTRTVQTPDSDS